MARASVISNEHYSACTFIVTLISVTVLATAFSKSDTHFDSVDVSEPAMDDGVDVANVRFQRRRNAGIRHDDFVDRVLRQGRAVPPEKEQR